MFKKSILHLQQNHMTYYQHFIFAASHGLRCIKAGLYLICHAIWPAIFQHAGSNLVQKLNQSFTDHKGDK